ncbi:uncharacterized protein LOC143182269 isoform X2 [Calliopsis andreniformis]|uniref:uncharacterized protein LOC143182269 isoform X2 n=1 Tax=Calliopsis andreniformis TaxID=337506 RepID=UPI003FCC8E98
MALANFVDSAKRFPGSFSFRVSCSFEQCSKKNEVDAVLDLRTCRREIHADTLLAIRHRPRRKTTDYSRHLNIAAGPHNSPLTNLRNLGSGAFFNSLAVSSSHSSPDLFVSKRIFLMDQVEDDREGNWYD